MLKILVASPDELSLSIFASVMEESDDVELSWVESGKTALEVVSETAFDLVVADEKLGDMTGLDFAEKLIAINPMVNCAAVSSLSGKEFHEASEGLGLLEQLPVNPSKEHAETLLKTLRQLKGALCTEPPRA